MCVCEWVREEYLEAIQQVGRWGCACCWVCAWLHAQAALPLWLSKTEENHVTQEQASCSHHHHHYPAHGPTVLQLDKSLQNIVPPPIPPYPSSETATHSEL